MLMEGRGRMELNFLTEIDRQYAGLTRTFQIIRDLPKGAGQSRVLPVDLLSLIHISSLL